MRLERPATQPSPSCTCCPRPKVDGVKIGRRGHDAGDGLGRDREHQHPALVDAEKTSEPSSTPVSQVPHQPGTRARLQCQ